MTAAARTDAYPDLDRDLRFIPLGVDEPRVLARADIDRYNATGFLFPFDVFDADEIGAIRRDFDDLLVRALDAGWDSYEMTNWHKTCRVVWDLVTHPRLVAFASDLLGEVVICRHSHFFCKLPGDGKRVSWHQPGRSLCTATGSCTAPSPTTRVRAGAAWRCATCRRTCVRSTAGTPTPSSAVASTAAPTGPTTRGPGATQFRIDGEV